MREIVAVLSTLFAVTISGFFGGFLSTLAGNGVVGRIDHQRDSSKIECGPKAYSAAPVGCAERALCGPTIESAANTNLPPKTTGAKEEQISTELGLCRASQQSCREHYDLLETAIHLASRTMQSLKESGAWDESDYENRWD
ncbi:hypothetical protein HOY82DRAFT_540382 [Tuber indicum]|nr:hypothetical protein HOY82DRAFT_540382 [Tuber indicum]